MTSAAPALRHDALLYSGEAEFVDALAPFARDGLSAGEAVIAVTSEANVAALRDALGAEASRVVFVDSAQWYRHPARTIAGYHDTLNECLAAGAEQVRVIGEVAFGEREDQQREWLRYEAALNHAFVHEAAWIVCPYDVRALPTWVVGHAGRTHPHLLRRGERTPSGDYTDPQHTLAYLASPNPPPARSPVAELTVDGSLLAVRQAVRRLCREIDMSHWDVEQLALAVNEAVTNALTHGEPPVRVRVYQEQQALVCEVEDAGAAMTDLLAGYSPPKAACEPESGMGLWLARQLCDHVAVLTDADRTTIRLSKSLGDC